MQRERNQGLYTADQNLNGNSATSTRQNPTSARAGLECPEERDYYPYWAPTPWRDLAIVTNTPERCEYFQMHSQNVQARGYCTAAFGVQQPISAAKCISQGGTWQTEPAFGIAPPECLVAPRAVGGLSRTAVRVPEVAQQNCALRLRYNITPAELQACSHPSYATQPACEGAGHAWSSLYLSASDNGRAAPPTSDNNPTVSLGGFLDVGGGTDSLLELAVSTNRFGRTFEDRSHAFSIVERPASVASSTLIHNLNVLGKRGNGAQTFPALTYGFTPPALAVGPDDFVHIQWTGNDNTNNNGNNNGEGTNDEDRHNIVQIGSIDSNVPLPASQASMFDVAAEVSLDPGSPSTSSRDQLALVREFALVKQNGCSANPNNDQQRTNCEKLNQAAATVDLGLLRFKPGTYTFMSTRNNNFGHRTQKGLITVSSALPPQSDATTAFDGSWSAPSMSDELPAPQYAEGVFLHFPPGSNNRLDEGGSTRINNYRLFDSQNPAMGGYGYGGDASNKAAPLSFIVGSRLEVAWSSQYGCAAASGVECQLVIQYMCNDASGLVAEGPLRDGTNINSPDPNNPQARPEPPRPRATRLFVLALPPPIPPLFGHRLTPLAVAVGCSAVPLTCSICHCKCCAGKPRLARADVVLPGVRAA